MIPASHDHDHDHDHHHDHDHDHDHNQDPSADRPHRPQATQRHSSTLITCTPYPPLLTFATGPPMDPGHVLDRHGDITSSPTLTSDHPMGFGSLLLTWSNPLGDWALVGHLYLLCLPYFWPSLY